MMKSKNTKKAGEKMSPQDKLERVLKDIHVMLSKCETYNHQPDKVIVDRKKMLVLLDQLNRSVFDMMEAYEQTRDSRNRAELEFRQKGKEIMDDASQKADDIYAASVLYTADMLGKVQDLIDQANESMTDVFRGFKKELRDQKDLIKSHETELEGQLNDLADTRLYRNMLEDVRRRQRRRQREEKEEQEASHGRAQAETSRQHIYTPAVSADVKINEAYFEKAGISPDDAKSGYMPAAEPLRVEKPEVKVNLNAEYFKRKAALEAEKKTDSDSDGDEESPQLAADEPAVSEEEIRRALEEDERQAAREAAGQDEDQGPVPDWKKRLKVLMKELVPKDLE